MTKKQHKKAANKTTKNWNVAQQSRTGIERTETVHEQTLH
jgi:hypothetical protein